MMNSEQLIEELFPEAICPITYDVMKDPVLASDGHSYEKEAFATWVHFHKKTMSPVTGEVLKSTESIPNHALRNLIQTLKARLPGLVNLRDVNNTTNDHQKDDRNREHQWEDLIAQLPAYDLKHYRAILTRLNPYIQTHSYLLSQAGNKLDKLESLKSKNGGNEILFHLIPVVDWIQEVLLDKVEGEVDLRKTLSRRTQQLRSYAQSTKQGNPNQFSNQSPNQSPNQQHNHQPPNEQIPINFIEEILEQYANETKKLCLELMKTSIPPDPTDKLVMGSKKLSLFETRVEMMYDFYNGASPHFSRSKKDKAKGFADHFLAWIQVSLLDQVTPSDLQPERKRLNARVPIVLNKLFA